MTLQTEVFGYTGSAQTWSPPSTIISNSVQAFVSGGISVLSIGPYGTYTGLAGYVGAAIPLSLAPLTINVGQSLSAGLTGGSYTPSVGGNGFSGGGGTAAGAAGAGSSAIRTGNGISGYTLLIEAGGADSPNNYYFTGTDTGGTGGGYASNTPNNVGGDYGSGSGGAQGGNGGAAGNGTGGGTGAGGGTNGNAGSGGTSGAGVGSGGLAVPQAGACYAASSITGAVYGATGDGSQVVLQYHTADAPAVTDFGSPTNDSAGDYGNQGITMQAPYNAPSPDTGALEAVAVKVVDVTASTTKYWNGTALVSSEAFFSPSPGLAATNGQAFTVTIPAGILTDSHEYTIYVRCQEANALQEGNYGSGVTYFAVQAPSIGSLQALNLTTLRPTISWVGTIPTGTLVGYRVLVFAEPQDTSDLPLSLTAAVAGDIYDSGSQTGTTYVVGGAGGFGSGVTYYAYVLAEADVVGFSDVYSQWTELAFTPQLTWLATPTLSAIPVNEPVTGMPAPQLTMTVRDNLLSPVTSSSEGIPNGYLVKVALVNSITEASATFGLGNFATAVQSSGAGTMTMQTEAVAAKPGDQVYGSAVVFKVFTARTATLSAVWLNAAGSTLRTDTLGSGSDNTATTLGGASGVAPANTASVRLQLSWASVANAEVHDYDDAAIYFGTTAPSAWSLGVGQITALLGLVNATAETTEFQYSLDGVNWSDIFIGDQQTSIVDDSGTTCVAYDFGAPFNVPLYYRCRNVVMLPAFTFSGLTYPESTIVSPWSNVVPLDEIPSGAWWIVPPTDVDASMILSRLQVQGALSTETTLNTPVTPPTPQGLNVSIAIDKQEQLGVFRPFGKSTATFVHGDLWDEEFDLAILLDSDDFAAFQAIREMQSTVLLKSDMEGAVYWVTMGPDFNRGILRETGRQTNPLTGILVHCTPDTPYTG